MVCKDDESTLCTVIATTSRYTQKISFVLRPSYTVQAVFEIVETQFGQKNFDLGILTPTKELIRLDDKKTEMIYEVPGFTKGGKNMLLLMCPDEAENTAPKKAETETETEAAVSPITPDSSSDDDLILGASASPTEPDSTLTIPTIVPPLPPFDTSELASTSYKLKLYSSPKATIGFVGLVNQAMTCYLNSLLQALFMTPEFRNALYNWEFDGIDEAKSIPYQLQKLFLNLQTSSKVAVETTDLTRSFGWDSTEAWQQHDIQELCRVMFDALERKFKDTEQADLINRLYEGKMIDYVKCLDCCTEKSREDTFLDIPLPVRPYGSAVAYGSIEEALRAFVQPETLDGNNQYFCEKCNKKCDAHKGLKFKKFPYILTLHLKRFDFDYQTLHRIKLNDKVTFPQTLNLNSFVNTTDAGTFGLQNNNHSQTNGFISATSSEHENAEGKCDDCSITDSGAVLEEDNCSGNATTASSSHNENDLQEDDEGIDMGPSVSSRLNNAHEAGPYLYELFAIMIHSGSASGGHYYAYIKEFENGDWYCFNDQTVSSITQEDIQRSFGGGSQKAYYSGVYSSSTNAYMLMYRQMDPKQNANAIKTTEFPEHITKLLGRLNDKVVEDTKVKAREPDLVKPKVYFYNPKLKQKKGSKMYFSKCTTMECALETAYGLMNISQFAPLERCRLVAYDHMSDEIVQSLEGREQEEVGDVLSSLPNGEDFLLEFRGENEEFEKYEVGGATLKVFKVNLETSDIDGPYRIRELITSTLENFKKKLAKKVNIKRSNLAVVLTTFCPLVIVPKDTDCIYPCSKVFVASGKKSTAAEATVALKKIVSDYLKDLTYMYVSVPPTDTTSLEKLAIPPYVPRPPVEATKPSPRESTKQMDGGDVVDAVMLSSATTNSPVHANHIGASGDCKRSSPQHPPLENNSGGTESNSEDSSLSDGDRTLVESLPSKTQDAGEVVNDVTEFLDDNPRPRNKYQTVPVKDDEPDEDDDFESDCGLYFRVVPVKDDEYIPESQTNGHLSDADDTKDKVQPERTIKVFVDKQMRIGALKRCLESHINVLSDYFTIVDGLGNQRGPTHKTLMNFKDGEMVTIELGRNLKEGEHKVKIYYLKLSEITNEVGKLTAVCDWIIKLGEPLVDVKRELITHLHKLDSKYKTLTVDNCRIWEKGAKNPVKILADDYRPGSELRLNCEMILQECENGISPVTKFESLTLFVRRWHPSTLELDNFQEITLERNSDIRKVLADVSGIPEENVAYSRVTGSFPCTNISLLAINSSMSWFTNSATTENYPLYLSQDGSVYFYKNNTETYKELSSEERREFQAKEKARLDSVGGATLTSVYSPRRERALKIYLDSSPKGKDE